MLIYHRPSVKRLPWTFYISPDKVPWATNCVPWGIRNYCPWDFTMISTKAHDGVLAGKCRNYYYKSGPGSFTQYPMGH